MCIAVPSRIESIDGMMAKAEAFGQVRDVNLMLLADEAKVGDYVVIQAGGFATEIVPEAMALELRESFARMLAEMDGAPSPDGNLADAAE